MATARDEDRSLAAGGVVFASPLIIAAKTAPPTVRTEVLERRDLQAALDRAVATPLTLLVAPAGYGKTTTLAIWCRSRSDVAWVTVDARDEDPTRLLAHILTAVDAVVPGAADRAWPALLNGADPAAVVVPLLCNELATRPDRDVVLLLDDCHLIDGTAAPAVLAALTDVAPPTLRLVLASRRAMPWPLARRRAAREVVDIGPDDLRLTAIEVDALINDRLGLGFTPEESRALAGSTEGWPAAVSLAVLRGAAGSRALVRHGVTPFDVAEYLLQEVLADLDEPMRVFLRRTSILTVLHPDVCRAVLDDPAADELLAEARRSNLLITPADADGRAVRYHQLLADLLRSELERWEPGLVPELHRRASAWLEGAGQHEDAIEHAILAGDAVRSAELLSTVWADLALARRFAAILSILDRLPGPTGPHETFVAALRLLCRSLTDGNGAAERHRIRELSGLEGTAESRRVLRRLQSSFVSGDVAAAVAACDERWDETETDPRVHYVAATQRSMLWWLTDDPRLEAVLRTPPPPGGVDLTMRVWHGAMLAFAAVDAGRRDEAVVHGRKAVETAQRHGTGDSMSFVIAYEAYGAALLALGDVDEAERVLGVADRVTGRVPDGVEHLITLILRARLVLARGDHGEARALALEARAIVDDCADVGNLAARLADVEDAIARPASHPHVGSPLSPAESRVLPLLTTGLSLAEIGDQLYLSRNTVRTHVRMIYRRLGVTSRDEAVIAARGRGLLGMRARTPAEPEVE